MSQKVEKSLAQFSFDKRKIWKVINIRLSRSSIKRLPARCESDSILKGIQYIFMTRKIYRLSMTLSLLAANNFIMAVSVTHLWFSREEKRRFVIVLWAVKLNIKAKRYDLSWCDMLRTSPRAAIINGEGWKWIKNSVYHTIKSFRRIVNESINISCSTST